VEDVVIVTFKRPDGGVHAAKIERGVAF